MSGKNNVNKDFYTIAGGDARNRDRVAKATPPESERSRASGRTPNFIPGALPVGEAPPSPRRKAKKASARAKPTQRRARRRAA